MDLSAFEARALELFSVSRRFREPLALLVLDIDNFQACAPSTARKPPSGRWRCLPAGCRRRCAWAM